MKKYEVIGYEHLVRATKKDYEYAVVFRNLSHRNKNVYASFHRNKELAEKQFRFLWGIPYLQPLQICELREVIA